MNYHLPGLTIHQVAERTGVSVHTLRAWERRYGVPLPGRGESNRYRLYDEQDIADVLWMKQQVEAGIAPSQAGLLLNQQRASRPTLLAQADQPIAAALEVLERALVAGDESTARRTLDEAFALFSPEQTALQVIQPAMQEIGERWMRGEITVWQEHAASHLVRQKLLAVLQAQPTLSPAMPMLVAAAAPEEEHELGLLIFVLLAGRQGWRTRYLGQRTPLGELASAARVLNADALAVSITTIIGLRELIPWLDGAERPVPLGFGGRLPNQFPRLREHLPGTFLGEDALTAARGLAGIKPRHTFWSPPRRNWSAAQALMMDRLQVAALTTAGLIEHVHPKTRRRWTANTYSTATLFLVDTITCALAFDVPELVQAESAWARQALGSRGVEAEWIAEHMRIFARALDKSLPPPAVELVKGLLDGSAQTR